MRVACIACARLAREGRLLPCPEHFGFGGEATLTTGALWTMPQDVDQLRREILDVADRLGPPPAGFDTFMEVAAFRPRQHQVFGGILWCGSEIARELRVRFGTVVSIEDLRARRRSR